MNRGELNKYTQRSIIDLVFRSDSLNRKVLLYEVREDLGIGLDYYLI